MFACFLHRSYTSFKVGFVKSMTHTIRKIITKFDIELKQFSVNILASLQGQNHLINGSNWCVDYVKNVPSWHAFEVYRVDFFQSSYVGSHNCFLHSDKDYVNYLDLHVTVE